MAGMVKSVAGNRRGESGLWLTAGAGALLAVVFVIWLFSHTPALPPATVPPPPSVAMGMARLGDATTDPALRDEAELLDKKPLFLPTRWNAQPKLTGMVRDPGNTVFENFAPKLTFSPNALALDFPPPVKTPASPADAFAVSLPPRPLLGFGRLDLAEEPLPERGGFLEVRVAGTGKLILASALTGAAPPAGDWAPLEFIMSVNAAGLVGPPQLARSSGRGEVDAYFRAFLDWNFRLGTRLPPGFFRVCIGP